MKSPNPFRRPLVDTPQTEAFRRDLMLVLDAWIDPGHLAIDLGPWNRTGELIRNRYNLTMRCTEGADLDLPRHDSWNPVQYIFALNILEHLFNPLLVLDWSRKHLLPGGSIIAAVPRRPNFLRFSGHFHELDEYRWQALIARAGLHETRRAAFRVRHARRPGLARPLVRYLLERTLVMELKPKE